MNTGGVRCWGNNDDGQLGAVNSPDWVPPMSDVLTGAQAIATGDDYTCALMETGGVRCWGRNNYGQLGDGTTTVRLVPPTTEVLTSVQAIAAGGYHTCTLMDTGGARCWGRNDYGQLGDGSSINIAIPPSADVLTGVQAIATGYNHTCALMNTGSVRCWGANYSGQRGDGTTTVWLTLVLPTTDVLTGAQAIATGGAYTCALMNTGGVRCWGNNASGQLGDGATLTLRATPPATDVLSGVKAIAASWNGHTCALTDEGGVRCWGDDSNSQLGHPPDGTVPKQVPGTCE
jgi:alpha-tubulin suppressor-like RCC1 family protein